MKKKTKNPNLWKISGGPVARWPAQRATRKFFKGSPVENKGATRGHKRATAGHKGPQAGHSGRNKGATRGPQRVIRKPLAPKINWKFRLKRKQSSRRPSRASEHGLIGETQPDAADLNRGVRHLWRCCFEVRNRYSLKSSATRKRARAWKKKKKEGRARKKKKKKKVAQKLEEAQRCRPAPPSEPGLDGRDGKKHQLKSYRVIRKSAAHTRKATLVKGSPVEKIEIFFQIFEKKLIEKIEIFVKFSGKMFFPKTRYFSFSVWIFNWKPLAPKINWKFRLRRKKSSFRKKTFSPKIWKKSQFFRLIFLKIWKKSQFFLKKICFVFGNPTVVVQKRRLGRTKIFWHA